MTSLERLRRFAIGSTLASLLAFCGGETDPGSSESHFLAPCQSTCASGLSCLCGVCTKACTEATACSTLGESSECLTPACAGSDPVTAHCDVGCSDDADCVRLGSQFACNAGRCRSGGTADGGATSTGGSPATGGQPGAGTTCEERSQLASAELAAFIADGDRSCEIDSDCVIASNASDCHDSCGAILSLAGQSALQAEIERVNSEVCAGFVEEGCEKLIPPCIPPGSPACVLGECVEAFIELGVPCTECNTSDCYVPGTGENPICSYACTTDEECGPNGLCQTSGGTGKWCFRRCASAAECESVNASTDNPLWCATRTDPNDASYGGAFNGTGEGFCIQTSEP